MAANIRLTISLDLSEDFPRAFNRAARSSIL
jgi:hypothetical protein